MSLSARRPPPALSGGTVDWRPPKACACEGRESEGGT